MPRPSDECQLWLWHLRLTDMYLRQLSWQSGGLQLETEQKSIGRWFKSGSKEFIFVLTQIEHNPVKILPVARIARQGRKHSQNTWVMLKSGERWAQCSLSNPRQSSGKDPCLSRRRPGFDSPSGRTSLLFQQQVLTLSHSSVCDIFIILVKAPAHYYVFIDTKVNIVNFEHNRIVIHFEIIRELVDILCYVSVLTVCMVWQIFGGMAIGCYSTV